MKYFFAFLMLSAVAVAQPAQTMPATLVLRNGKVVTVDAKMPEAQAIAIRGDRIAAVGSNDSIQPYTSVTAEQLRQVGKDWKIVFRLGN